jgi:hypothetical protein
MVQLDKALFGGNSDQIANSDIVDLEVTNFESSADKALKRFHWKGGAVASVGLILSADNRKVHEGFLVTRGKFETGELQMEARHIWREADHGVTVTIRLPTADVFRFTDGGMCSDYISAEEVVHFHHITEEGRAPRAVLPSKLAELGVESFCLRMTCQLSKSSSAATGVWLKYVVLLFPEKKETLLKYEAAKSAAWPGLKLYDGEMAVLPRPSAAWKCPVLPLIWPGTPFEQLAVLPTGDELRLAIGAIFNKSNEPSVYKSATSLAAKWDKLIREKEELSTKAGPVTWPKGKELAGETGWCSVFSPICNMAK